MKNFRKILCLFLALFMIFSAVGCSNNSKKNKVSNDKITITDHNGNTVKLPRNIQRIVVCDIYPLPSVLSIFFDSAKKIVGIPDQSMSAAKNGLLSELYPEILNAKTSYIKGTDVNVEELASLKPDVVFYSASSKELGEKLKKAGFNAVAISANKWGYNSIETLNNWILLLSQIFPDNNKSKTVKDYSNKTYDMVHKRVANISDSDRAHLLFLFNYNQNAIATSGSSFFGEWWAEAIGAVNVAKEIKTDNAVPVNMEQIHKWNPDKILITNFTTAQPKDLYNNTIGSFNWSKISAIENKQVYKMPLGMYRSYTPGVDTPVTLLWLAKTVYPKLFADINITEEVKKYYKTVFKINLTDKQADSIFNPASAAGKGF